MKPGTEKEVDEILKLSRRNSRRLITRASSIQEKQFEKYLPLIEDLRQDSHVSMFNNIFITMRRMLMLYLAMFILH